MAFSMRGIFVESSLFEKYRDNYLSHEEYRELLNELLLDPKEGGVSIYWRFKESS